MDIIMVSSEAYPFAKSGGMGDVVGALTKYLPNNDFSIKLFLPAYSSLLSEFQFNPEQDITFSFGESMVKASYLTRNEKNLQIVAVAGEDYFNREKMYGFGDDLKRFIFFSRAVFEYIVRTQKEAFILHCHDWESALLCAYTKMYWPSYRKKPKKVIFTIHNLAYQGIGSSELFKIVNLPGHFFTHDYLEFYGNLNLLKAGLVFSDVITTVSPSYAREIATPEGGEGLDGLIRAIGLRKPIIGIVNGIDTDLFNPATDKNLPYPYTNGQLEIKKQNKLAFYQQYFPDLKEKDALFPLISFISRLVEQKGLDLILNDPDKFFNLPLCWFFLGVGEAAYENSLTEYAKKYPNLHVEMAFNNSLARFAYGASDMLAMPSRFEPCGISQMIAMRYGTIPVVRKTGGLIDTVIDYRFNPVLNNGFQFDNYRPDEFIFTLERALNWYNDTPELWKVMVKNAMDSDFSWKIPVQEYLNIYLG